MKYRIIILIIIIISLGQMILSYMENTSRTHSYTHDEVNAPCSPIPLAMNDLSVHNSNKQSRMRRGIRDSFGCFSHIKNC